MCMDFVLDWATKIELSRICFYWNNSLSEPKFTDTLIKISCVHVSVKNVKLLLMFQNMKRQVNFRHIIEYILFGK